MTTTTANYVRNTELAALLNAATKTQSAKLQQRLLLTPLGKPSLPPMRAPKLLEEAKANAAETKTHVGEPEELRTDIVPFTLDEVEWLEEAVERNGHANISRAIGRLIDWANAEPAEAKKKLFLVIRCRRCSAGAKGGIKRDHNIELSSRHWQWLENVRERCRHASVGKTLRIIVDFYMPLCKEDHAFEQKVLRAGMATKSQRIEDAVGNVDPAKGLAIRVGQPIRPTSTVTQISTTSAGASESVKERHAMRGALCGA